MGLQLAANVGDLGIPLANDRANAVVSGQFAAVGPKKAFAFQGPFNLVLYASINTALTTTAGSLAATVASGTGLAAGDAINSVNVPPGATIGALAGTNVTLALEPVAFQGQWSAGSNFVLLTNPGTYSVAGLLGAAVDCAAFASGTTVEAVNGDTIELTNPATVASTATGIGSELSLTPNGNAITTTGADGAAVFTGAGVTFNGTVQLERTFDGGKTWLVCNVGGTGTLAQWTGAAVGPISVVVGEPEGNVGYRLNCTTYTSGTINYRMSTTGQAATSLAIASTI